MDYHQFSPNAAMLELHHHQWLERLLVMTRTNEEIEIETDHGANAQAKARRGFAAMDEATRRRISSMGGKAAHAKGTAHEFTSDTARAAGRKGGQARNRPANAFDEAPTTQREGIAAP